MKLKRQEGWGTLIYDTGKHEFIIIENEMKGSLPYINNKPVVLNIDLTFECNMNCKHCVAKDTQKLINKDLFINKKLIDWINKSHFMVLVITGGEPLLQGKEKDLLRLISNIHKKGIIIDTNGTIIPSRKVLNKILEKNILLRVSMDSINPNEEISLRKINNDVDENLKAYYAKLRNIKLLQSEGITVTIQSVLSLINRRSILGVPKFLAKETIKNWHVQRFIPSHKTIEPEKYSLDDDDYQKLVRIIQEKCKKLGIKFFGKMDKRHNSVFLLVGDGELYTQGNKPGQKIHLGNIYSDIRYFDYVSSSDHSARYYGSYGNID